MEQADVSNLNYLFPAQSQPYGSGYRNPFQSALNGAQGGGGVSGDPQGDQNSRQMMGVPAMVMVKAMVPMTQVVGAKGDGSSGSIPMMVLTMEMKSPGHMTSC